MIFLDTANLNIRPDIYLDPTKFAEDGVGDAIEENGFEYGADRTGEPIGPEDPIFHVHPVLESGHNPDEQGFSSFLTGLTDSKIGATLRTLLSLFLPFYGSRSTG